MTILSEIVSSRVRAEIFRILFGVDPVETHMRELARQSGCAIGTIQTELKRLHRLNLVVRRKDGNRVCFRANREHPLFQDIQGLVVKTVGLVDVLKISLDTCPGIVLAFVFGSLARDEEQATSDIDLMVVGSVGLRQLADQLAGVAERLGREVNPHVMAIEEFSERKRHGEHFVTQVVAGPKLFIKGTPHELEQLG